MTRSDSKVVDLNEFKAARASRQLDLLTAETIEAGPSTSLGTNASTGAPGDDRSLSTRHLAHRARMLAHLEAVRR